MKKRIWLSCLAGIAVYAALLAALAVSESRDPSANIRGLGDALWYSLVTLSTVGYGDLYPVSLAGRIIGFLFVLMSAGVLASLIGLAAGFAREWTEERGRRLRLRRGECWIFSERNPAAAALAKSLSESREPFLAVFCGAEENAPRPRDRRVILFPGDAAEAAAECGRVAGVFLTGEDPTRNAAEAEKLEGCPVFCRGEEIPGTGAVRFFDEMSCTARAYWQRFPLREEEKEVWILGDGKLARALLDQAVLVNCRVPFRRTVYRAFGDWRNYERMHPGLLGLFSGEEGGEDTLVFCPEARFDDPERPGGPDRVILCADQREKNCELAVMIRKYFPLRGAVHIAGDAPAALGVSFGGPEEIWTEDTVIRGAQDRYARKMHETYSLGAEHPVPWEALSPFLKASNRAAADHARTKLLLLAGDSAGKGDPDQLLRAAEEKWRSLTDREPYRRNEHARWMRFHALYNWKQGPEKNGELRTHPDLIPYEELSRAEQEKDDYAWEILWRIGDGRAGR